MRYFAIQKHRKDFLGSLSTCKIIAHDNNPYNYIEFPKIINDFIERGVEVRIFHIDNDNIILYTISQDVNSPISNLRKINMSRRIRQTGINNILEVINSYNILLRLIKLKKI